MIKKITYIFIGLLIGTFVTIANAQVRVLTVPQGGTGAATLTGCLQGNGTSAITGTGSACGSGSGSSVGWASTTADINSIYFTGGSTGKVGIGTTTPYANLSVLGGSTASDTLLALNNRFRFQGDGVMKWGVTANAGFLSWGATNAIVGSQSGYDLSLYANGGEKMKITTGGLVGIGTTTPYAKLAITNTGSDPSFVVEDSTSPDTTPFIIDASGNVGIGTTDTTYKLTIQSGALNSYPLTLLQSDGSYLFGVGEDASGHGVLQLRSASAVESAVLRASGVSYINGGNVGIGTSTPLSILNAQASGGAYITLNNSDVSLTTGEDLGGLDFYSLDTSSTMSGVWGRMRYEANGTWDGTTGDGADLIFSTRTVSDGSLQDKMILTAAGNLGIGTTSPYAQLSVGGRSTATTLFSLDALSGQTQPILDVKLASTTQFSISSVGNTLMTYASTTALSGTTLCISTDCRTAWPAGGAGGSGAGWASTTLDINSVYFTGGATGKIGIGTSTPNATLTIAAGKSFYSEQSILSTSTSMTVNFDNGQNQLIRTGVSDTTVAFSNGKVGQKVELTVCNPTTTSGAISFTGEVSYRGGISPSHTTTANECDIYVWQVNYATSTAKYFLMDMKSGFR